jgi:hypothetical protein
MVTAHTRAANGGDVFLKSILDFWSEALRLTAGQSQVLMRGLGEATDMETLRKRWLETLAESLDLYMRSPVFLETMKHHFEVLTQVQSTAEDLSRDFARSTGLPRINDISGLFERLQVAQEAVLARLSAIEERLEALETRDSEQATGNGRQ